MPKAEATDEDLQANLDYACAQQGVDCRPIQDGGACYLPNTVRSHAAYAMNQLYQNTGRHGWDCDFQKTAVLTRDNPSTSILLKNQFARWLRSKVVIAIHFASCCRVL